MDSVILDQYYCFKPHHMETTLDEDLIEKQQTLVPASKGKRFANYIIDSIIVFVVSLVLVVVLMSIGIYPEDINTILDRLIGMLLYALIMMGVEGMMKGKSIGKLITKTRAVTLDGKEPDFATIAKRSFCRIVPFEAFSFLGSSPSGWHDKWGDTMVIDEEQSEL